MAKVKVTTNFDSNLFSRAINAEVANQIGKSIIEDIRDFTAKGQSSVRSEGRFVAYSGQADKKKYPNNIKGKSLRPVNLTLTGEYLKSLAHKVTTNGVQIAITGAKNLLKFEAHNEGKHPHVPERRILPSRQGEQFLVSIERNYLDLIKKRISDLIVRSNKK